MFHGVITNHSYVKFGSGDQEENLTYMKIAEVTCVNHEVVTSSSDEDGESGAVQWLH